MTITATAVDAAARARALAYVILSRAALHPAQDALTEMVEHLDTAALAFEAEDAPVIDGVTVTNTTPIDAGMALVQCMALAVDNPAAGIPDEVFYYVTAPISRRPVDLPQLNPVSTQHARQEGRLRTQIALAAHDLDASSPADETTRIAHLAVLLDLHRNFARVAAAVAVDNARPCNRL
ncbi:hypothetical protein [Streptomyces chryseus]|uniref:Uncharacterized protein n=2 Tax=Streptomyces chryseus TaxID=68186 RepID=A0ABQ3DJF9_9ACTN|nr:hypothetical protein [Streptomyces chryseus]GHA94419.1 hypothetical protein GCM10010346_16480 [Streptomyces chryseus]